MKNRIFIVISSLLMMLLIVVKICLNNVDYTIKYVAKNDYLAGNYLNLSSQYSIDNNKLIISRIESGTTVYDFINSIGSTGTMNVLDSNNNAVNSSNEIKTGYILRVNFGSNDIKNYKLSVIGDVLGQGLVTSDGAKKTARHVIGRNVFRTDEY